MNGFGKCPRCGNWSVEHLKSHSHCWECSYSPDEFTEKETLKPRTELIRNIFGGFVFTKVYA